MNSTNRALDRAALDVANSFSGLVAWPTVVFALLIFIAYIVTIAVTLDGTLSLWLATPIVSLLVYAIYTPMHEAVHQNVSGRNAQFAWLDWLLGFIAGFMLGFPFMVHKREHFAHHRSTNDPELDPDWIYAGPPGLKTATRGLRAIKAQYSWYLGAVWPGSSLKDKIILLCEIALIVGSRVGLLAAGYFAEFLLLGVLANVLGVLLTVYLFAWLPHHTHENKERYTNTSTYHSDGFFGRMATTLWLWQNYHSIHHLFPKVPFFRYRLVFDRISDTMRHYDAPIYNASFRHRGQAAQS